jgi:hypothetical protein
MLVYRVGQNSIYLYCVYMVYLAGNHKYMVIYSVYTQSWPALLTQQLLTLHLQIMQIR